tara:strand:+ start:10979 stop:11572 length:594 start_codon:yes stop_codon:yes gene_type:complete
LSFRIEDKLYINKENLFEFKEFLNKKSAKKIHQPRVIESLYFDNIAFQIYKDSVEGLVPRKKIRVRNYPQNNDTKIYLEIKNSSVEGRFKTRKIINNRYYKDLKSNGIFDIQYGPCKPILYVKYNREYLFLKDVRISIDTNIMYKSFTTNYEMKDDRIIAELKTSINKDFDELIEDFPLQRIRFSKYSFGVEKLFHH